MMASIFWELLTHCMNAFEAGSIFALQNAEIKKSENMLWL